MNKQTFQTKYPFVIGVTGHRNLLSQDALMQKEQIKNCLSALQLKRTPLLMYNSLAQGADMLCADVAMELQIPIVAVLPCEEKQYVKSFDSPFREKLHRYIAACKEVIIAPDAEQLSDSLLDSESFQYRQAGIYVSQHSSLLIALWDGKKSTGNGCGTADIVHYMLNNNLQIYCDLPFTQTVFWVKCRREGSGEQANVSGMYITANSYGTENFSSTPPKMLLNIVSYLEQRNGRQ